MITPIQFRTGTYPGENFGFADYLSRHPKNKPTPPSEDDTKYIINLRNDFIFGLNKNLIENTSVSRTLTDKYQPINNATNNYPHANYFNNAFCLNSCEFKSPSITSNSTLSFPNSKFNRKSIHNSNSIPLKSISSNPTNSNYPKAIHNHNPFSKSTNKHNSKFTYSINSISTNFIYTKYSINPQGLQQINVSTRNRPRHNNFDPQIPKRKRAPNKPKSKMSAKKSSTQTIATKTKDSSNKDRGRSPIRPDPSNSIFPLSNATNMPQYCKNLDQVFGEEFVAEATARDKTMAPIIKLIRDRDWETLKKTSPYFYSFIRDLIITPSGRVHYDNRLMVSSQLKQLVIDYLHQTHPGQTGMLRLADLVWFPMIHRDVTTETQSCGDCIKKGKNLKPLITKIPQGHYLNSQNQMKKSN